MSAPLSRRTLLLAGSGMLVAGCGAASEAGDKDRPGLVSGSFRSEAMDTKVGWSVGYPTGHEGRALPVVISLHGRRCTHRSTFTSLGLGGVLDRVVEDGTPPFALASVDGGDHSYWHRRTDGTDAAAMVRHEFVPVLAKRGLDTTRIGLYGWSMGGYGALLLAAQGMRMRAVAASSPALFTSAGSTPAGAFDDAGDYDRNDVFGHPEWLDGVPVHLDCGRQDPFYDATRVFASELSEHPGTDYPDGGHNAAYWHRAAVGAFGFLGERLAKKVATGE